MSRTALLSRPFSKDTDLMAEDEVDDFDLDDFGEIGLSIEDLDDGKLKLDRKNPPKLSFEHYSKLKGIDFSDRGEIRTQVAREQDVEWQQKLEDLREATKNTQGGVHSAEELAQIKAHKIEEPTGEDDLSVSANGSNMDMPDDSMASSFGADGSEMMGDALYENVRVAPEDVYDPGAFPLAMETDLAMPKKTKGTCIFCLPDTSRNGIKTITYTNIQLLHKFINERGMITGKKYNYNCAKHQRKVKMAIKQARYIGLLSYTDNFVAPESFAVDDWGMVETAQNENEASK